MFKLNIYVRFCGIAHSTYPLYYTTRCDYLEASSGPFRIAYFNLNRILFYPSAIRSYILCTIHMPGKRIFIFNRYQIKWKIYLPSVFFTLYKSLCGDPRKENILFVGFCAKPMLRKWQTSHKFNYFMPYMHLRLNGIEVIGGGRGSGV